MASRPDVTDSRQKEADATDDRQYELVAEMVSVQRKKIELAGRFLEIGQQETQRHYDLAVKELEIGDEQNKRAYRLVKLIVGGFSVVFFLLLYMVFFGSEAQAGKAEKILTEGAKALGGAGFIFLIYGGLKRLINR